MVKDIDAHHGKVKDTVTSDHMHQWLEHALIGTRMCAVCGMVVTFDHRENSMDEMTTRLIEEARVKKTKADELSRAAEDLWLSVKTARQEASIAWEEANKAKEALLRAIFGEGGVDG